MASNSRWRVPLAAPSFDLSAPSSNGSPSPSPSPSSRPTQPTLLLICYDRNSPPSPTATLEYDLQITPNLPNHILVLHTGLSKGLREGLPDEPDFAEQLERAENEIKGAMTRLQAAGALRDRSESSASGEVVDDWVEKLDDDGTNVVQGAVFPSQPNEDAFGSAPPTQQHRESDESPFQYDSNEAAILRVGCLSGSGHPGSVAFAEELARREWPWGWAVRVECRDLTSKVHGPKAKKRRIERV
ncbi:hypothetical protein H2201_008706 [Coniosporium apollinis]|uniref:Uncharacterized protein n=1 Tax=Coniosporium apollinis TaxID=61459 RepID=A0ABQ9NJP7_9PEZI|nr:hypothetical protein H2201_008706 [Coniosporium apollinis]